MNQFRCLLNLACVAWLAILFICLPAQAQTGIDRVQRRNGSDSGQVTETTPLGVTISKSGVTSQIPAEEIRSITFDGEPPQFNSIRRALNRSRFDSAQEALGNLDPTEMDRPEVRQEFEFLSATVQGDLALAGKGDMKEAIAAAGGFLSTNRTSYHVPEVIELQGNLYLAAGDAASARKKYETLAKAPAAYYKARSALLVGQLLQREGIPNGAIEQFDAAIKLASGNTGAEEMLTTAKLQRAVSMSAAGKSEEGIEAIKLMIVAAPSDEEQLLAQGYNALGDSYLAAGNLKSARNAYLHVDLLFATAPDEHAEALYKLARIWEDLKQPTRAKDAQQRLSEQYPLSPWSGR
ncbi:tetratricopeptide repeat protein [Bythopirellula polymerisocia]|uniref:Tetratricopeptide repeat protein n=1 Tax=Bythopirellula polymerisocia TaxID=2528003 RepID=A0A5C6CTA0_9BACT|nr:tetratricopeptide repeat protein [Bythopirellula polymerisocia]TWU27820.1 Tetratricopeptide repeat protein [Bythopirellula polymerisocia]